MRRTIVLAIDGLSWNIVNRLRGKGKLENIGEMMDEGAYGNLKAEPPLISPRIWTSIFTGMKPESHGISDFFSLENKLACKQIWDLLDERDFSLGIYRPWSAWSVREVDGFFVPGFFSFSEEAFPEDLNFIPRLDKRARQKSLSPLFLLRILSKLGKHLDTGRMLSIIKESVSIFFRTGYKERLHRKSEVEFQIHSGIFEKLLREKGPDFSTFYNNSVDLISHNYWKDIEEKNEHRDAIPKIYERIDDYIGRIRNYARSNGFNLVVLSDHGFEGLESPEEQLVIKIPELLEKSGFVDDVFGMNLVDMAILRTKDKSRKTMDELLDTLRKFTLDGEEIFKAERDGERITLEVKDFVKDRRTVSIETPLGERIDLKDIIFFGSERTGKHSASNGVFLLEGPDIKKGHDIESVAPEDVTPTLLALSQTPIPKGMDGEVLEEVFKGKFEGNYVDESMERKKENGKSAREEDVKEKLKELGYL